MLKSGSECSGKFSGSLGRSRNDILIATHDQGSSPVRSRPSTDGPGCQGRFRCTWILRHPARARRANAGQDHCRVGRVAPDRAGCGGGVGALRHSPQEALASAVARSLPPLLFGLLGGPPFPPLLEQRQRILLLIWVLLDFVDVQVD